MSFFKKRASKRKSTKVSPEWGLPALPNEVIPSILTHLDERALSSVARVSLRFNELSTRVWLARYGVTPSKFSSDHLVFDARRWPASAFPAANTALWLRSHSLTDFTCILPPAFHSSIIQQLTTFVSSFSITRMALDFGHDMILRAKESNQIPRDLRILLSTIIDDSPTTVVILQHGLFTCRPGALRRWSPETGHYKGGWAEATYSAITMHDGSRQNVPTISSLTMLNISPLNAAAPVPFDQWKLVVVDASLLTELDLSVKLTPDEWDVILDALALPNLQHVGLWAQAISVTTSTLFLNRHPTVHTLKNMTRTITPSPDGPSLRLPQLDTLNALAPYVITVLRSSEPSSTRLPRLALIELRPHAQLDEALLLASAHAPLTSLALWTFSLPRTRTPKITFPTVHRLILNEPQITALMDDALPAFLAVAFPALDCLEVNYAWMSDVGLSAKHIEKQNTALARRVAAVNPGVRVLVDSGNWTV
ncbi:hypothetical protein FB45DRAFT_1066441 [Roridomyces roridus]|uniref:F-box domain-containing protein n=1 Tax=Roridomyces roridus TaxID=1738132 RepID=A0AAD7B3Z7_9AGAR|nr:hypothetical protein FB45DRAFT_1066441 [Roridomyces roridus]